MIDPKDWEQKAETDGQYAIAWAILRVSAAIDRLAVTHDTMGTDNFDAIGDLATRVGDRISVMANTISQLPEALADLFKGEGK